MPRLTTAEATVETLLRHGIDTVYAMAQEGFDRGFGSGEAGHAADL